MNAEPGRLIPGRKAEDMATEAQKRATLKYDAENTVQIKMKLNRVTDADILELLDRQENKQGFIKELLRAYIKNNSPE